MHPNEWVLLSNMALSPQATVALYVMQWRVETVFRTLQTGFGAGLGRGKVHSIIHGVSAACLLHTMCRLFELAQRWTAWRRLAHRTNPAQAWSRSSTHHRVQLVKFLGTCLPSCKLSVRSMYEYSTNVLSPSRLNPCNQREQQHTVNYAREHCPLLCSMCTRPLFTPLHCRGRGVWPLMSKSSNGIPNHSYFHSYATGNT